MKTHRSHHDAMVESLRRDPAFAEAYLAAAFDESGEPGGSAALMSALRQVAEARGESVADIARRTGLSRETLYRTLSRRGNPTLASFLAILKALDLEIKISSKPGPPPPTSPPSAA